MIKSKIKSLYDAYNAYFFFLSILLAIFSYLLEYHVILALLCVFSLWIYRYKTSAIHLLLISIGFLFLIQNISIPSLSKTWTIIEVHSNYAIATNTSNKVLLYSQEPLPFDSHVSLFGEAQDITSEKGFFQFDFASMCKRKGITKAYGREGYTIIQENLTIRSYIQQKIEHIEDVRIRSIFYKLLLNIKDSHSSDDLFFDQGFSLLGILVFLRHVFQYLLDEEKSESILFYFTLILCMIYRFPISLLQSFLFQFSKRYIQSYRIRFGIVYSFLLILFPYEFHSIGFLLPFTMRLCNAFHLSYVMRLFLLSFMQSLLFGKIYPLLLIFFQPLRILLGLGWFYAVLQMWLPKLFISNWLLSFQAFYSLLAKICIYGTVKGLGTIPFLLALYFLKDYKWKEYCYASLLYVFLVFGLFHPFAEVSFINIGQGDAILLRAPLNQENILIDTGKPNKKDTLYAFLQAKGITHVHHLFITHMDDDHSGNMDAVIKDFNAKCTSEHFDEINTNFFSFYDCNQIKNEDENQSSMVLYTNINGLKYLLMGDADTVVEEEMIRRYVGMDVDVLKLGHHGSQTSTSESFLDQIKPRIGIISAGKYNLYHHPSPIVIDRLDKRRIPYFNTHVAGDITIICLPFGNLLLTSEYKFDFIMK